MPDRRGNAYTDPSYHVPAFYEVWAKWADDGRSEFWRECAAVSREYLHKAIHPQTGLNPDQTEYDGTPRGPMKGMGVVIARRNDEAIQVHTHSLDCFAALAMTTLRTSFPLV
ncbi:hypothetical protein FACS1894181_18900 [Bacteroidia bacterium]|nr:hypothetical protein FACS1894181_18900 [Bacteroidia bacterium]